MKRSSREQERTLRRKAREQAGYFTAAEAKAVGYGYRLQHFHRSKGNWMQVERGVYRLPDYPATDHEDLVRWALWSRGRDGRTKAVVSHDTALSLHELGDVMPGPVHLTVPRSFRKKPGRGCVMHRADLDASDIETREGFLVTTPLRTLLDAAAGDLSPEHLASAVRAAVTRGAVRRARLIDPTIPRPVCERLLLALLAMDATQE